MKEFKVSYSKEAEKDLDDIYSYIAIEKKDNIVYITTRGYGHGVGLSQYGANEMAKLGYTYEEILKYYYKDIEINNV